MTFPRNLNVTLIPLTISLTKTRLQQLIHQYLCLTIVILLNNVTPFTLPKFSLNRILTRNKKGKIVVYGFARLRIPSSAGRGTGSSGPAVLRRVLSANFCTDHQPTLEE